MKRKIILLLFVVFILCLQTAFGQDEKEVSQIRSSVHRTGKLLSIYEKTTKSIDDISLEGIEATFYSSNRSLKKIHSEMAGETYNAKADFYYSDSGKLIFIYYQFNRYNTQIGMNPPPKVVRKEERRLYLKDGKIIKKITTITETAKAFASEVTEKDILDLEKTFKKAFRSREDSA